MTLRYLVLAAVTGLACWSGSRALASEPIAEIRPIAEVPDEEVDGTVEEEPVDTRVDETVDPGSDGSTGWGMFGLGLLLGGVAGAAAAIGVERQRRHSKGRSEPDRPPTGSEMPPPVRPLARKAADPSPTVPAPLRVDQRSHLDPPDPQAAPGKVPPHGLPSALLDSVINSRDRIDSHSVRDSLGKGLESAGISEIRPAEGERFDVELHEGTHPVPTNEQGAHLTIAAVESPGYRSPDGLIRPARVQVYRYEERR